jgi:hypothetical protein
MGFYLTMIPKVPFAIDYRQDFSTLIREQHACIHELKVPGHQSLDIDEKLCLGSHTVLYHLIIGFTCADVASARAWMH